MADPRGGGELQELVAFDKRAVVDDGYGNPIAGDWVEQFRLHAGFTYPQRGSEPVTAARLESRQPVVIRVRASDKATQIGTDWQARDVRRGTLFNIRTITNDNTRAYVDILVEYGVATG